MRQMEEVWNKNMADELNPYWINILDKIIMEWYYNFAPGFMCVGKKPNTFGIELHKICYEITLILWRI